MTGADGFLPFEIDRLWTSHPPAISTVILQTVVVGFVSTGGYEVLFGSSRLVGIKYLRR